MSKIDDIINDINNQTNNSRGINEIVKDIVNHYAYITGEEITTEETETEASAGGESNEV